MPLPSPIRVLARKVVSRCRTVSKNLGAELAILLRGEAPLDSEDRRVLEGTILPELARRDDLHHILFVGSDWYTRHYRRFFEGKDYWTLDRDARKRRHGARRHVVDSLENLLRYAEPGTLDLIVCNGVFGWGLDRREEAERAFEACLEALRPGGVLVFGWNDRPENRPFPPYEIPALQRFDEMTFEPLGSWRHRIRDDSHHTFDFLRKPDGEEPPAGGRHSM